MKTNIKHLWSTLTIIGSFALISARPLAAQTFKTIHNFAPAGTNEASEYTNADGCYPVAPVTISGNTLYGAAGFGGIYGSGTIFSLHTDGTGFTNLHTLAPGDGAGPYNALILSGGYVYGTTYWGDNVQTGNGTVFKFGIDGAGFTPLVTLEGAQNLIQSGDTLYGTSDDGNGTVFKVNTDGTGFVTLYSFSDGSDGAFPDALVLSGTNLYGTAANGGASSSFGSGTVFKLGTNGAGFSVLYTFTAVATNAEGSNNDGAVPWGLSLSGNTLYGTAIRGGTAGNGTLFAIKTDGSEFTVLHTFTASSHDYAASSPYYEGTNSDGVSPQGSLTVAGNTLYGTAALGGSFYSGTVYSLNTDGTDFKVLHAFSTYPGEGNPNSDGFFPRSGLAFSGNTLYGTTQFGGTLGGGTIFSISLPPQLSITASAGNVILTWPTNVAGLTLQSTPSLTAPAVWMPVSPGPVVVNALNTVTNPMTGSQQFYRLSQ
ncbi:MAG TPA: choice-of-anchor tandem repeat GloVer-containing protein [Verrucomicrobiae bacterium]|nr:choice-of-anchor tandem repeat GloVer-containing protein [Verrucomicrobiae bacterium]